LSAIVGSGELPPRLKRRRRRLTLFDFDALLITRARLGDGFRRICRLSLEKSRLTAGKIVLFVLRWVWFSLRWAWLLLRRIWISLR